MTSMIKTNTFFRCYFQVPSSCSAGGGSSLLPYGHGNVAEMAGWLEQSVHPLQLRVDDGNDGNDGTCFLFFLCCFALFIDLVTDKVQPLSRCHLLRVAAGVAKACNACSPRDLLLRELCFCDPF